MNALPASLATIAVHPQPSPSQRLTQRIKRLALEHGLSVAAVTSAEAFPEALAVLNDRIAAGHMAGMPWFTTERAAASCEPRTLMAEPRSILSVGVAYWGHDEGKPDDGVPRGRISRYARGIDYHDVLPRRMRSLHASIEDLVGHPVECRFLTDHARIVDRAVAARAGLGWYGKNACIIVPGHGSWVMLGEMLLDLDLEPDRPLDRDCGRCSICIDRCPTGAIVAPYTIHAPACISFQTIEQRGAIPRELRPRLGDWVFGCDVCQEVCPYTRAAADAPDPDFMPPSVEHAFPSLPTLLEMSTRSFRVRYRGSAVMRARRTGMARNAAVALGNIGTEDDAPTLARAVLGHDEPLVRGHAAWALGRIGGATARRALGRAWERERDAGVRDEIAWALVVTG
jgi:epoxyqueuosine reductase